MLCTQPEKSLTSTKEDGSVMFCPSQTLKTHTHLKKYLKWKYENSKLNESKDLSHLPNLNQTKELTMSPSKQEKVIETVEFQPPLPPYPPPPDVCIKQEIDTEDFQYKEPELVAVNSQLDTADKPEESMCRNFVRGTCKKGAACKFVHKIIKDQLKNVYTFCKEFQNRGCYFSRCKFVHCTIFEQENFYRTGELPPYATEHLKPQYLPPPLPQTLGPNGSLQISPQIQPQVYVNDPTYLTSFSYVSAVPGSSNLPIANGYPNVYEMAIPGCSTSRSVSGYSQYDAGFNEPPAKKVCKECHTNSHRYQYFENKVKEMVLSYNYNQQKIDQLDNKTHQVFSLLECIVSNLWTH